MYPRLALTVWCSCLNFLRLKAVTKGVHHVQCLLCAWPAILAFWVAFGFLFLSSTMGDFCDSLDINFCLSSWPLAIIDIFGWVNFLPRLWNSNPIHEQTKATPGSKTPDKSHACVSNAEEPYCKFPCTWFPLRVTLCLWGGERTKP